MNGPRVVPANRGQQDFFLGSARAPRPAFEALCGVDPRRRVGHVLAGVDHQVGGAQMFRAVSLSHDASPFLWLRVVEVQTFIEIRSQ